MTTTTTARAIVIDAPGEHRLVSGPRAEPGPGEARVSVYAAGICASDRELYDGARHPEYVRYPITPGHEWSGIVDAVGEGVDPSLVGRKTVAEGVRSCQACERCREGLSVLCQQGYDETGFTRPGAFADSLLVPARLLHLLPDDTDLRAAALLEPSAVVADAVLAGNPRPGERVAVVGAGTLGLLAVQLLSASSPAELLVVDPRTRRVEQALDLGATRARTPEEADRNHFDLVLETAGAPDTAQDACLLARRGGRVVLAGMPEPGAQGIDPVHLVAARLVVRAVFGARSSSWSHAVRALANGLLDPAPLISHTFPLSRFADAMALAGGADPDVGKVLLTPGEG